MQCFMISNAIIMIIATVYQFLASNKEDRDIVIAISILILVANVVVSLVFGINFTI